MRLWPKSLLGQVLLAVALALLAAQAISAVLLLRASDERREQRLVGSLAVQLIAASNGSGERFRGQRRMRVERSAALPALAEDQREHRVTRALRELLVEEGLEAGARVQVVSREALADPRVLRRVANRRPVGRGLALTETRVVLASVPQADGSWLTARTMSPPRERSALRGLFTQTAVLFVMLLLAMWLILRRITRPLAALTGRVEAFAITRNAEGQLVPRGPDDVRRLIAAHNAMEARVAAMLDEKDVMLGAIGHDLKTPLAALRVRIESVEDEAERAKMAAGIEDIVRTLDDILSLARVGRASAPPERTDLYALAAGVVEEFEDMGDPVILLDGTRVVAPVQVTWAKRALRNLVSNAVRYGGGAEVSLRKEGREAVLRVTDNGPGIAQGRLVTITEPFVRGEASRNRGTGGAGLGLTLARAIAEAHGGRLVLANQAEGGLSAELRLPL
jgi:signal transduction histidine kinase